MNISQRVKNLETGSNIGLGIAMARLIARDGSEPDSIEASSAIMFDDNTGNSLQIDRLDGEAAGCFEERATANAQEELKPSIMLSWIDCRL